MQNKTESKAFSSVQIQKELISDLKKRGDQREEIRDSYRDQREMQYQNKVCMELLQIAEITAEKVKCGCINAIREGKCYPFY